MGEVCSKANTNSTDTAKKKDTQARGIMPKSEQVANNRDQQYVESLNTQTSNR
jgi:hypothetical protein